MGELSVEIDATTAEGGVSKESTTAPEGCTSVRTQTAVAAEGIGLLLVGSGATDTGDDGTILEASREGAKRDTTFSQQRALSNAAGDWIDRNAERPSSAVTCSPRQHMLVARILARPVAR